MECYKCYRDRKNEVISRKKLWTPVANAYFVTATNVAWATGVRIWR